MTGVSCRLLKPLSSRRFDLTWQALENYLGSRSVFTAESHAGRRGNPKAPKVCQPRTVSPAHPLSRLNAAAISTFMAFPSVPFHLTSGTAIISSSELRRWRCFLFRRFSASLNFKLPDWLAEIARRPLLPVILSRKPSTRRRGTYPQAKVPPATRVHGRPCPGRRRPSRRRRRGGA